MAPRSFLAVLAVLAAASVAGPARARGREIGVFAYGANQGALAGVRRGLEAATEDTGGHLQALARLRRRGGRHLAARVARCRLGRRCLHRLARRLRVTLVVAEVRGGAREADLTLRIAWRSRRTWAGHLAALDPADVEAAAYGFAYRALGGHAVSRLNVGDKGAKGRVRIAGAPPMPMPVVGCRVPAGAVHVTVTAAGYLPWNHLVMVRPGTWATARPTLKPDVTEIPLAALVPKRPAPKPAARTAPAPAPAAGATPGPGAPGGSAPVAAAGHPPDLSPAAVARAATATRAPAAEVPRGRPGIGAGAWVTLGAGVAALAAGAFFGVSAQGNSAAAQNPATAQVLVPTLNKRMGRQATAANILLAAGTAVTGLGTWLLVHDLTAGPATGP